MIKFENLRKVYKTRGHNKVVIDNLNLDVDFRNTAILGGNGAGKSTLMRLLSGVEMPTSGRIIRRVDISWPLGFRGGFSGTLTAAENCRLVARLYGRDSKKVIEFVRDFAEIGRSFDLPLGTYSSGMRARVAFGLSMAIEFDCYLVDELTAVGDARFKAKARALFTERMSRSRIIMVSHSMSTLRRLCEVGILLKDGRATVYDDIGDAIRAHERNMGARDDGDEL